MLAICIVCLTRLAGAEELHYPVAVYVKMEEILDSDMDIEARRDSINAIVEKMKAADIEYQRMRSEIRSDALDEQSESWVGTYAKYDGTGMSVDVSSYSGCTQSEQSSMGRIGRNFGDVYSTASGVIQLRWKFPRSPFAMPCTDISEVVPIQWGEHRYLIDRTQFSEFIDAANSPEKCSDPYYWDHTYYLNVEDRDKQTSGEPRAPEAFTDFLRKSPIQGEITGVDSSEKVAGHAGECDQLVTIVRISVGAVDGVELCEDFELCDDLTHGLPTLLTITRVEDAESYGEIRRPILEYWPAPSGPELGWRVAAGPWRDCDKKAKAALERYSAAF